MKFKKFLLPVGCVLCLALLGLVNFLAQISIEEAAWSRYLAEKNNEKVLAAADSFRQRWDNRFLSLFPSSYLAGELARLDWLEGQAAYNQRYLGQAIAIFKRTKNIDDPAILSRFHYNQAVICVKIKKYDLSVSAYEQALRFDPGNKEAAYNLEVLRKALRQDDGKDKGKSKSGLDKFDIEDFEKWSKDKQNQDQKEEEKRW
jgi:tetratricopeptide (TPR) repeat protein